jgi:hypothetical protein
MSHIERDFVVPLLWFSWGQLLRPPVLERTLAGHTPPQRRKSSACSRLLLYLAQSQFRGARFRTGHADFRTAGGNVSTLPRSAGGHHFETLRKLCGV